MSHEVGRGGHMNTYQGRGTSKGKIIRLKRHFASLIFGIISRIACPGPLDKYSYKISKPKLLYIKQHILYTNQNPAYNT